MSGCHATRDSLRDGRQIERGGRLGDGEPGGASLLHTLAAGGERVIDRGQLAADISQRCDDPVSVRCHGGLRRFQCGDWGSSGRRGRERHPQPHANAVGVGLADRLGVGLDPRGTLGTVVRCGLYEHCDRVGAVERVQVATSAHAMIGAGAQGREPVVDELGQTHALGVARIVERGGAGRPARIRVQRHMAVPRAGSVRLVDVLRVAVG